MNYKDILDRIPPDVEALIFDLDGTLADTMPTHIKAWEMTGDYFGVPITGELINEYAGAPSQEVIKKLNERFGWEVDPMEAKDMKTQLYYQLFDEKGEMDRIQPAFDVMVHFYNVLPMAVGTGSNRYSAERVMKSIGADNYISHMVSADDIENHKPHPETFLECAKLIDANPLKCLVFEDGPMGVIAAQRAEMRVMYLPDYVMV